MKTIKRYFYDLAVFCLSVKAFGQVTGVQTAPGTYPTLAALVNDLKSLSTD